jgi:hypothetical protein
MAPSFFSEIWSLIVKRTAKLLTLLSLWWLASPGFRHCDIWEEHTSHAVGSLC